MSEEFAIRGESYALVNCYSCGVRFLVPAVLNNAALERRGPSGRSIHCPNGHSWYYVGETEADKLRRERDRLKQEQARLIEEREAERARAVKAETAARRLKKRAQAGTCPACNRTFANMARHMKGQHPGFGCERAEPRLKVVS